MKVRVGYITAWRRAIFFSLVAAIIFFGTISTASSYLIGVALISNMLGVLALLGGVILVLFVVGDRALRFEGFGEADFTGGRFVYKDKKRKLDIKLSDIKNVDIEEIALGQNGFVLAYQLVIRTEKRKYYIESERTFKKTYQETDLYNLYLELQKQI